MSEKATGDSMNELHALVAEALAEKIKDGSATAAELSAAIRFLKDNNIEADVNTNGPLKSLAHEFPDFDQDEENELRVN